MTIRDVIEAGTSLRKMVRMEFPIRIAYRLTVLIEEVNKYLAYFDQNAQKIRDAADANDAALTALLDETIGADITPVEIDIAACGEVNLSAGDILALHSLVRFTEKRTDSES